MLASRTLYLFAAAALLATLATLSARLASSKPEQVYSSTVGTEAKHASADFVPDGDLTKPGWKHAKWLDFDNDASGKSHYHEVMTRVASLWTEANIYFAFSARYDSLNIYEGEDPKPERWQLWDRDVVEVFLNPQPERVNHYFEFEVAPNNQWIDLEIDKTRDPFNDASWNSGFEHATRIDTQHHIWTTEMRIPLAAMNVKDAHSGAQWRVNFFRAAGKGGDDRRKFLAWSIIPEGKTFHVPTRFGILKLVN
ncbi:MAG TPA: carbohydrate-binding family 9-like protein [Candidatus Acidoferrum sp.]|nr:carbohydrate-binding family 9-like protein [Candidatus Acidoferrum sp.]